MFNPSDTSSLCEIRLQPKLHHKGALDGEGRGSVCCWWHRVSFRFLACKFWRGRLDTVPTVENNTDRDATLPKTNLRRC